MDTTFIYSPSYIIMGNSSGAVLKDYSVLIREGLIKEVLPSKELTHKYPHLKHITKDVILLPAFVNTHTHLANTNMPSNPANKKEKVVVDWFKNNLKTEHSITTAQRTYHAATTGLIKLLKSGVLTLNDMSFYSYEVFKSVSLVGLYARLGETLIPYPSPSYKNEEDAHKLVDHLKKALKSKKNIRHSYTPITADDFSEEILNEILREANTRKVFIHTHWGEYKGPQLKKLMLKFKESPSFNNIVFSIAHGIYPDQFINFILKKTPSSLSINITSNHNRSLESIHLPYYIEKKYLLTVGTDSTLSSKHFDFFEELRTIYLMALKKRWNITPRQIITWATINGAKSLGFDKNIGTIEKNKDASFFTLKIKSPSSINQMNVYKYVIQNGHFNNIEDLYLRGKRLINRGELSHALKDLYTQSHNYIKKNNEQFLKSHRLYINKTIAPY